MTEQQTTPANTGNVGAQIAAEVQEQASLGGQPAVDHSLLEEAIGAAQKGLDLRVQEIRDDKRLTKEEQRQQISQLWDRVSSAYPQILQSYERKLSEDVEAAENRLFYVAGEAQRDSVRSAYNDLYDRVSFLHETGDFEGAREELERHAVRARRTGDRALQTAVGHLSTELGVDGLRDSWLATSEEKSKAWADFVEARTKQEHFADPQERLFGQLSGGLPMLRKPEEA